MWYKQEKQYRWPNHDYSNNGWYFVTIITKDKEDNLGNVISCANDFMLFLLPQKAALQMRHMRI